jgi:hypothetical protein
MSGKDPIDRSLRRMEMRRFLTRCEAQEGTIQRADTLHEVARLATIAVPFPLTEDTDAMDARRHVKKIAEERARELFENLLDHLIKAEPFAQEKMLNTIGEEILQFGGGLSALRTWAYARLAAVEQTLPARKTH